MLTQDPIFDGKYRIVREIGQGGMGAVFEGVHTLIHRRVAIKVLHPAVSDRKETVTRFEREAQAAGRIGSPHIVEVLDLGTLPSGVRYLVMEYLDGESLGSRLRARGKLAPDELVPLVLQLLEGVGAAHAAGIVHRDLKPENVFLQRRGRDDFVKILDFGISKFNLPEDDGAFGMTTTGAVMGTPYYMAPEQARGTGQVDHRADIYAVGVILYECLTGKVPFDGTSFNQLMFKIVLEDAPRLADAAPDVDPALVRIVEGAMARNPELRYPSAAALREALAGWANARARSDGASLKARVTEAIPASMVDPNAWLGTNDSWAKSEARAGDERAPFGATIPSKRRRTLFLAVGAGALVSGALFFASGRLTSEVAAPGGTASGASVQTSPSADATSDAVSPNPPEARASAAEPLVVPEEQPFPAASTEASLPTASGRPRAGAGAHGVRARRSPPPTPADEALVNPKPVPTPVAPAAQSPTPAAKVEPASPKPEATSKARIGDRPIRTSL